MNIDAIISKVKELRSDPAEDSTYRTGFKDARQQALTILRQTKKSQSGLFPTPMVPRCPSCGTSVEPELMLLTNIYSDDTMVYECPACQHEGPQADNKQDALKAFYGEAE